MTVLRLQTRLNAGLVAILTAALISLAHPTDGRAAFPDSDAWPESNWPISTSGQFQFAVQPPASGPVTVPADAFAIEFGPQFSASTQLVTDVLGSGLDDSTKIYVYFNSKNFSVATSTADPILNPHSAVIIDGQNRVVRIDGNAFLTLSDVQRADAIAYSVGALAAERLSHGIAPSAVVAGLALYLEYPTQEQLARLAALVQTNDKNNTVSSWFDLYRGKTGSDAETDRAEAYAITAYLVSRFDFPSVRSWLSALGTGATWQDAMRTSFVADPTTVESDWRTNLPTWTTTGWRDNLMSAFDLQPARDLIASGQYLSAKAVLDTALNLYRQLDDPDALAEVQNLVNQADTGIQAEALMVEVETALSSHDYERASNLLDQAEIQYRQLPSDQVPDSLMTAYRQRANDGMTAVAKLKQAQDLAGSWGSYPQARAAAEQAGSTFAILGDTDNHQQAQTVIQTLDNRQRRLVILVAALAAITLAWLALWLRSRGRPQLRWGYR